MQINTHTNEWHTQTDTQTSHTHTHVWIKCEVGCIENREILIVKYGQHLEIHFYIEQQKFI